MAATIVQAVQQAYPQDAVERWTTEQHRSGLTPILRRVWIPRGQRPGAVDVPAGVHRHFLPPYSPAWQPAERL